MFEGPGMLYFSPLRLSECSCVRTGEFNRLRTQRRADMENRICYDLQLTCQNLDEPINILSLGAGGFLQDWILLGQLIKSGYTNINYSAIDPEIKSINLERFTQFFEDFEGVNVNVNYYGNVDWYTSVNPEQNLNAVIAIDFDDLNTSGCWSDINTLRKLLMENQGKFYMSYNKDDIVIDSSSTLDLCECKGFYDLMHSDLAQNFNILPDEPISIAVSATNENLGSLFAYKVVVPIIFYLHANCKEATEINLVVQGQTEDTLRSDLESFSDDLLTIKVAFVDDVVEQKFDLIVTYCREDISLAQETSNYLKNDGVAYRFGINGTRKAERVSINGNAILDVEGLT